MANRGPDLTSLSALMTSALREWKCNDRGELGTYDDPSITAWQFVRPTPSPIDPNNDGMEEEYAFTAGFDMALQLAARLIQDPFAKVDDIVENIAAECKAELASSVENRTGVPV